MHDNAHGSCIQSKNLAAFHKYANEKLKDVNFNENYYDVNFVRSAADKDLENLIDEVSKYENIWSTGNDEPRVYIHDINISSNDVQVIGKNKDTVKFTKFGITYIKFHATNLIDELRCYNEMKIEVIGRCKINEWMGATTYQILIEGYEIYDNELGF